MCNTLKCAVTWNPHRQPHTQPEQRNLIPFKLAEDQLCSTYILDSDNQHINKAAPSPENNNSKPCSKDRTSHKWLCVFILSVFSFLLLSHPLISLWVLLKKCGDGQEIKLPIASGHSSRCQTCELLATYACVGYFWAAVFIKNQHLGHSGQCREEMKELSFLDLNSKKKKNPKRLPSCRSHGSCRVRFHPNGRSGVPQCATI